VPEEGLPPGTQTPPDSLHRSNFFFDESATNRYQCRTQFNNYGQSRWYEDALRSLMKINIEAASKSSCQSYHDPIRVIPVFFAVYG